MFNIDRSYIQHDSIEETLQSKTIFIRSRYRNDPTLPKTEKYGVTDEEYEDYMDKKQNITEWQRSMKAKGPIWLGILFCAPPVIVNLYDRSTIAFFLSFVASIVLVACLFLIYKGIVRNWERRVQNSQCDAYTEELIAWYETKKNGIKHP